VDDHERPLRTSPVVAETSPRDLNRDRITMQRVMEAFDTMIADPYLIADH
jgi:hypothetical protein